MSRREVPLGTCLKVGEFDVNTWPDQLPIAQAGVAVELDGVNVIVYRSHEDNSVHIQVETFGIDEDGYGRLTAIMLNDGDLFEREL